MESCPVCGLSSLAYCRECSHSWDMSDGVTTCQHAPDHVSDRSLHCASCGGRVSSQGVIRPDGTLVVFPKSITKLYLDLFDQGAA